jgi:hypothetical protein
MPFLSAPPRKIHGEAPRKQQQQTKRERQRYQMTNGWKFPKCCGKRHKLRKKTPGRLVTLSARRVFLQLCLHFLQIIKARENSNLDFTKDQKSRAKIPNWV